MHLKIINGFHLLSNKLEYSNKKICHLTVKETWKFVERQMICAENWEIPMLSYKVLIYVSYEHPQNEVKMCWWNQLRMKLEQIFCEIASYSLLRKANNILK